MERLLEGRYTNSVLFINELRRMMPRNRDGYKRPPPPLPSPALSDLRLAISRAVTLPSIGAPVSSHAAVEALARGENVSRAMVAHNVVPDTVHHRVARYSKSVYGGRFIGEDGARFVTSCQDCTIRVYDTGMSECAETWRCTHSIVANDVRWTVTDFDVSPDGRWLAYASISKYVRIVDLENEYNEELIFDVSQNIGGRVNIWSLTWSHDGTEIIMGTSAGHSHMAKRGNVIVYNLELRKVVEVIVAHDDDVNSVCFLQQRDRNAMLSGSDDAMVKMWDRRDISKRRSGQTHNPCGTFVGHQFGITFLSPKNDGRFLLSNSKDQFAKLWDARKFTASADVSSVRPPNLQWFDYRIQNCPPASGPSRSLQDDAVMTYGGEHETLKTLIRARFSPLHTTGQKYIYCGSSDGRCVVYDVLTGKMVVVLEGHKIIVRDVSWHPVGCFLTTSSWDGQVLLWSASKGERVLERAQERAQGPSADQ